MWYNIYGMRRRRFASFPQKSEKGTPNLKKIANFRELTSVPCENGRHVKEGLLFRSGHLAKKNRRSDKKLSRLGIHTVVDLRSPSETAEYPEKMPRGCSYYALPPLNDEQNPSINKHNRRAVLKAIRAKEGGAREHLRKIYRTMVSSPDSTDALSRFMEVLLENDDGAVLWHCTQGKDRTGIAAAAVLLALGADRDDVMRDYMRSNRYYRIKNALIFAGVSLLTLSIPTALSLNQLLSARREYLLAAFDEIDEKWGGTSGFLTSALGLDDAKIHRLREKYLA